MEGESVLDAIYDEEEEEDDVEMVDVEEGELVAEEKVVKSPPVTDGNNSIGSENPNKNKKKKKKRRRNRKNRSGPDVGDIDRFVLDVCRRLKEKKSYMVYTAVGCLGVHALSNLVNEVDVVQSCGGQMTADGRRHRTGGGVLWNIIKAREPVAYKEIMKRAKEFEKQFKLQSKPEPAKKGQEVSSQETICTFTDDTSAASPDGLPTPQNQLEQSSEGKRRSVHERLRVPVSYGDLLGDDHRSDSL